MKTVVFQSYRTTGVPGWIGTCMATVKGWAQSQDFDYRCFDDSFLDLAPAWYRERCAGEICTLTDLCRLIMAHRLLESGYGRTLWVDADMLVFAPQALRLDEAAGFAFCLELWPQLDAAGQLQCSTRVNNSMTLFTKEGNHLDFFQGAALRIAAARPRLHKLDVGTNFLTGLGQVMPLPLFSNVGIFSPVLMHAIATGDDAILAAYGGFLPQRIACANLCHSLAGERVQGYVADETIFDGVVDKCLATQGDVVNAHVRRGRTG